MSKYDIAIIGSGPGGYVAAIRFAQLGFKTAIIEKYNTLGGTCLNVGCIPSKALLDSSEHFHKMKHEFSDHGINVGDAKLDFTKMIARKQGVVDITCDGVAFLMKKNKIDVITGTGSFKDKNTILINGKDEIQADKVIIATGSKPIDLPFAKIDKDRIVTSTGALKLKEVPKHLVIVGGGIIALEMGSVYLRLGSEVTVLEYADRLTPGMDGDISKELKRVFSKQGMKFQLSTKVNDVSVKGKMVTVKAENKRGEAVEFQGDYCLVAVGRKAYTEGLGLENVGITTDDRGRIETDGQLQTNVPGIYAIGDVVKGAMLAHKAEEEGVFVAEVISGQKPHIHYNLIPGVCYTWPEASGVGATEEELKESKAEYKVGKFPFKALGRSRASMDTDGFVKILADKKTDEILGVHIVGARAADLIMEAVVAMEFRASAEDICRMSHPHPTYSEAFKEACMAATENRAIHV
jgi:dihydrolipoamide dehydrogenase